MSVELPKWPQMRVVGQPITQAQAKEILFRTDSFLTNVGQYGGNDEKFNKQFRALCGIGEPNYQDKEYNQARHERIQRIAKEMGFLELYNIENDYAVSAFIYGPKGWCSPTGEIYFEHNIGKYPDAETVQEEWTKVAEAFPFLSLTCTLYSGESCEDDIEPVITYVVTNGTCTVLKKPVHLNEEHGWIPRQDRNDFGFLHNRSERGLPHSWYEEFALKVASIK